MARDLIVIGASAGGVEALQRLTASLPTNFNAAIFVVVHSSAGGPRLLADILDRSGPLHVSYPEDGQRFARGQIYVAPPDYHLLLEGKQMRVLRGPKEHRTRPALDPLFLSAAFHHGARVVGIVLSGYLGDGAVASLTPPLMFAGTSVMPPVSWSSGSPRRSAITCPVPGCWKVNILGSMRSATSAILTGDGAETLWQPAPTAVLNISRTRKTEGIWYGLTSPILHHVE